MVKINDSIIIKNSHPYEVIYVCPGEYCNISSSINIPVVNSYEEAFNIGWTKANAPSDPERTLLFCPECSKKL